MKIIKKVYECEKFHIESSGKRGFLIITKTKNVSIEEKIESVIKLLSLIDLRTDNIPMVEEIKGKKWGMKAKW